MLPSVLAEQLQDGLRDYIDTTFPITNPVFKDSLSKMLRTPDAVFHEPYVAVRLPFRTHEGDTDIFKSINLPYAPYVHQYKAWERLNGEDGRSTLVATGTGSGKTECFLYPILEYCYKHKNVGEEGIKALIIYPMNALASDQAGRIAKLIDSNDKLKESNIRVGMYVGGEAKHAVNRMMPDQVITDHETLLQAPPDILLTNYKMLDYLLIRPKDAELWKNNSPETLKYIAVDELHTFDGAQGTDLACLLRRLKSRLFIPAGQLCCVGTSATMGDGSSTDSIRRYAEDIFGEPFEDSSVITEDRLSSDEFFDGSEVTDFKIPSVGEITDLRKYVTAENQTDYLSQAVNAWFDESFIADFENIDADETRVLLGKHLMHHNFAQDLIALAKGSYIQNTFCVKELRKKYSELRDLSDADISDAINALYALISHARTGQVGKTRPFLNVQVQVWMRELRRLLAKVTDKDITYALSGDLNDQQAKHYLPVINCRDCGETGWVSLIDEQGSVELTDLSAFYNAFFAGNPKVRMIFPYGKDNVPGDITHRFRLCPDCMDIELDERPGQLCSNGHETIPVWIPELKMTGKGRGKNYTCPFCGSTGGLAIMGIRSATAISAGISEIYSSKFNDDKKMLAFTDNVQDAAHHAGFYNNRTWRFLLRSAMQQYFMVEEKEYSLKEFADRCVAYWKASMGKEDFAANFMPQNLTWMRGYENLCSTGHLLEDEDSKRLIDYVTKRFDYEIYLEYGLSSRIGRSLEKAGCSVVSFDVDNAIDRISERIANEVGVLQSADRETFTKMVLGFLTNMRINGAFFHPAYQVFLANKGSDYTIQKLPGQKWMPAARKGRNVPKFIAINNGMKKVGYFDEPNNTSWYGKWIQNYLPVMHRESDALDISKIILEELTGIGLLQKNTETENVDIYGIDPEKCTVSGDVRQLVCDECGAKISVSGKNASLMEGACCMRSACNGHMHVMEKSDLDFYGKLYTNGEMIRIVAKEHTGLLQRDDRESLERTFKKPNKDKRPWEANLLSCTPTLEMGIDIGDLSTVVLCSIPPAQAQYAQRSGRAGRTDGNALTVAVANAKPHDLYFYEDPMEMIAGNVTAPRVFLKASAVLARQFTAYCMDCWVKAGKANIPDNIGPCLQKLDEPHSDRFPNNFLDYVQTNTARLVRTFLQIFTTDNEDNNLDEATKAYIRDFASGQNSEVDSIIDLIKHEFESLKKQRDTMQSNVEDLSAMIKDLESKPKDASYDEEISNLRNERSAWAEVVKNINQKNVYNFLSDSGLLPNYAFPEAGIILKAILYRLKGNNEDDGKGKFENKVYEYNRSASAAISEFAPLNDFYVDGKKLKIDQVDLGTSKWEPWRMCPNCSHAELDDSTRPQTVCPKCGSPGWSDASQVRHMLRVQMVYSNMKYDDSLMSDEGDDRSHKFFDKEMLVDVDEDKDIIKAYRMDNKDFTFAYDFVRNATMREINFGEKDVTGDKFTVAGREAIRKGFRICKHCGKIQIEGEKPKHTRFCRMMKPNTPMEDSFEDCLFLYREFHTEALRILVPATTQDSSNVRQESFVAAFMLGLKEKFGNVDHLNACISEVPVPDADYRKQYLVIYDTVPGGTGYLKQLMGSADEMIDIMQRALDVMLGCSCQDDPNKDGCYKCLFAYRQSHHIGEISRKTAISLFQSIISGKDNLEEISSLQVVDTNSLFDSELERRFVEAFNKMGTAERDVNCHKQRVNEKDGYFLRIGSAVWEIEPQVDLDREDGVLVKCRPDFVLWPKRVIGNKLPVAIFTDGFLYHKDKAYDDTLKRMAIMLSGKFHVWSLSYKDVQSVFNRQGDYYTHMFTPEKMPGGERPYFGVLNSTDAGSLNPGKKSAFELLMYYLEVPEAEDVLKTHAFANFMSLLDIRAKGNQLQHGEAKSIWDSVTGQIAGADRMADFGQASFGRWRPRHTLGNLDVVAEIKNSDMALKMQAPVNVLAILDDDKNSRTENYEADWNGFWQFANLMQFSTHLYLATKTGIDRDIYTVLNLYVADEAEVSDAPEPVAEQDDGWNEIIDQLLDDVSIACANEMRQAVIPAPSIVGFELENSLGAVIAEAEMAWEEQRIAFVLPEQEEYADVFRNAGWKVLLSNETADKAMFGGDE